MLLGINAFIHQVNQLAEVKEEAAANIRTLTETVCETDALASERDGLCGELDALSGSIERMVKENARTAMDQEAYREKEERLCGIYAEKYERLQEVERLIEEKEDKRAILTGLAFRLLGSALYRIRAKKCANAAFFGLRNRRGSD